MSKREDLFIVIIGLLLISCGSQDMIRKSSDHASEVGKIHEQRLSLAGVPLLEEGEGDCDNSLECAEGLVCLNANGEREEADSNDHGFVFEIENDIKQPGMETCEQPLEQEANFLPPGVSLLSEGEGDCDNSLECAEGLVCLNANGEREEADSNDHGFVFEIENDIKQPGMETCEQPIEEPLDPIEPEITLLGEGEGDCDNSLECAEGLVCLNANGEREESDSNGHGFVFEIEDDIKQPGSETCESLDQSQDEDSDISSNVISFADFIQNTSLATMNKNGHAVNFYRGSGKLPRENNYELSITNVDAQYVLYVESHGRNGHDDKNESNRDVDIDHARLLGIGGGTDKYLALFKVDNNAGHITIKDRSVGAVQIYFIKTNSALNFQEAWSVDPSVSRDRDPHYKNVPGAGRNSIVLYADDEGGKNASRDATYIRSSFIRYGNGDDRLYVYDGSLDKNNGNGAYMIVNLVD